MTIRPPLRVMSIAGTRPEAIKFAPLVRALSITSGIDHVLIATGQHGAMFHEALDPFGVLADIDLAVANESLEQFCADLRSALGPLFASFRPDLVLVQGDTSSAWIAARAAAEAGIAVGHVEAGLRSGDPMLPWPEERNRREIDMLSSLLFAPSARAAANLIGMQGRIHVTGNTGIDAMRWIQDHAPPSLHPSRAASGERHILVTCHRRESIADIPLLMRALVRIADRPEVRIHLPTHPNPLVASLVRDFAESSSRIVISQPLPYPVLLARMSNAHLLLTDSGGLQEEAPAMGLPTLVLRRNSERPEPIESGNAILVGMDGDRIRDEVNRLLDDPAAHAAMARPCFPYGQGGAAERIVEAILAWADQRAHRDRRRHG